MLGKDLNIIFFSVLLLLLFDTFNKSSFYILHIKIEKL